jgi:copper chaperone NosL
MRKANKLAVLIIAVIIFGCGSGRGPVDIESGDMCSFCRMAISEKRFAAEIVQEDETVLKFDDIGCMLRYHKADNNKTKPAAIYVVDNESKNWLPVDDAYFVKSETIKTPMSSGIAAFASAEKVGSDALRFSQLEEK